jgi:hypothetical protein
MDMKLPWLLVVAGCATTTEMVPVVPLTSVIDQQMAAQAPDARRMRDFLIGQGERTDFVVNLEAGRCYWFSGAADAEVERLSMYLWGPPSGHRLADSRPHSRNTTLGYCPMMSGNYKFQAKIEGEGRYLVGVYEKPGAPVAWSQPWSAPPPQVVIAPPPVVIAPPPPRAAPAPECRMGSDGQNTCGYNCRLGSDGHFYCSSVPNGHCALNSDGSFSCP